MADPPGKPAPEEHVVKEGERMSTIAHVHGFRDYHALYLAQSAELRKKRPNPEILMPGDRITLAEKVDAKAPAKDKTKLKYEEDTQLPEVRLHLQIGGKPFAKRLLKILVPDIPYSLGLPYVGTVTTDDKGVAVFKVDPLVSKVVLICDKPKVSFALHLGSLRPATEAGGVEQRLDNLGYRVPAAPAAAPPGSAAEKMAKEAQERLVSRAVGRFQESRGAHVTGKVDDTLRAVLVKAHEP